MNLDELISKYIDGELTEYEDDFLRQRISADKHSRKKFDNAINLSLAFKEDAKHITPPIDLVERTEDIVLMKILAKAPESGRRRAFVWSNASMLAASIIALMFLTVFQISDFTFKNKEQLNTIPQISKKAKNNKLYSGNNKTSVVSKSITKSLTNNKINVLNSKVLVNTSPNVALTKVTKNINKNLNNDDIAYNIQTNKKSINHSPVPTNINTDKIEFKNIEKNIISSLDPHRSNNKIAKMRSRNSKFDNSNSNSSKSTLLTIPSYFNNNASYINGNNEVQVASFFGTDIVRTSENSYSSVISHFSQSVAYAISNNERLGVELGYTEYVYDEKAIVNVKQKFGGISSGVENNESGYDFTYQHQIVLKNSKQMIWASIFYENSFLTTNSWALIARVGLGATNEGPLSYGRVFTKYNLFSSLDITLGAEGRLYSAQLPTFVGDNNKFQASCSLIYGFQFKF